MATRVKSGFEKWKEGITAFVFAAALPSRLALAADKSFTGVFSGYGRACSGGLFVRAKTIEWNSSFGIRKPTGHQALKNFQKRREPGWADSTLDERMTLDRPRFRS
ncbi:MAG: hypothetical protein LBD06_12965 [Candidatus Accumulibacter sp.]|jgi:hypothetical protein|nr:hypothetical protein [Accumulibacter sp.]